MILTCPACATSYFVPDTAIGTNGRRVRCKSCGQDWRAHLEDEPLELSPEGEFGSDSAQDKRPDPHPDNLAEVAAPELPKAFRAKAEQRRRMRRAATLGATWVGAAVIVLGLILALLTYRLAVVQAWPQTASFYRAIGFPVNIAGVEVEALRGRSLLNLPDKVIVGGALRNIRDHEVVPPNLIIILRDNGGKEVVRQPLKLDGPPILPGKVQGFAAVVSNPEGKGSDISIDFDLVAETPALAAKSTGKTAPKPRPLPESDEGLRAVEPLEATPMTSVPLDKNGS